MSKSRVLPIHGFPETEDPIPFTIKTFDDLGTQPQDATPHQHEFYAIQYVTGGKGNHIIDFS